MALLSRETPQLAKDFRKIRFGSAALKCVDLEHKCSPRAARPEKANNLLKTTDMCGQTRAPVSHVLERCHVWLCCHGFIFSLTKPSLRAQGFLGQAQHPVSTGLPLPCNIQPPPRTNQAVGSACV